MKLDLENPVSLYYAPMIVKTLEGYDPSRPIRHGLIDPEETDFIIL